MSVSKAKRLARQRAIFIRTLWILLAIAMVAGGLLVMLWLGLSGLHPHRPDPRPAVAIIAALFIGSVVIVALVWRAVGHGSAVMNTVGYLCLTFVLVLHANALAAGGIRGILIVFLAFALPIGAAFALAAWLERRR